VALIGFRTTGDVARPVTVTVPALTWVDPVEADEQPGKSWQDPTVVGAGQFAAVPGSVYDATAPDPTTVSCPAGAGKVYVIVVSLSATMPTLPGPPAPLPPAPPVADAPPAPPVADAPPAPPVADAPPAPPVADVPPAPPVADAPPPTPPVGTTLPAAPPALVVCPAPPPRPDDPPPPTTEPPAPPAPAVLPPAAPPTPPDTPPCPPVALCPAEPPLPEPLELLLHPEAASPRTASVPTKVANVETAKIGEREGFIFMAMFPSCFVRCIGESRTDGTLP